MTTRTTGGRTTAPADAANYPQAEVLGVYVPTDGPQRQAFLANPERFDAFGWFGPEESGSALRDWIATATAIEILLHSDSATLDPEAFKQKGRRPVYVAGFVNVLSPDGTQCVERINAPVTGPARLLVYVHGYRPDRPLASSVGILPCPEPQPLPDRLWQAAPYGPPFEVFDT